MICRWANQRKVFGRPLHSQALIRSKLAGMISRVESAQSWLENITYQMNHMTYQGQSQYLAGLVAGVYIVFRDDSPRRVRRAIGFLKKISTESAQQTARDAVQVFGGRGVTRSGMGRLIEHVSIFADRTLG